MEFGLIVRSFSRKLLRDAVSNQPWPWWHLPCTGMGLGEAVPSIGSCVAGLLFGTAWLLWIDGVAFAATEYGEAVNGAYWVPGTLQTIGLIMVNVINWGLLTDDSMMDDGAVAGKAKAWVVVAFVLCFSGVIGSVWILVQEMQHPSWDAGGGAVDTAVRCLLQNLFLFGSSLPAKLTRPPCLAPNRPLVPVLYVPKAQGSCGSGPPHTARTALRVPYPGVYRGATHHPPRQASCSAPSAPEARTRDCPRHAERVPSPGCVSGCLH